MIGIDANIINIGIVILKRMKAAGVRINIGQHWIYSIGNWH